MPAIQRKPDILEKRIYAQLPDHIKDILGGPENITMTATIMRSAQLTEDFRPYINTLVFGLFIGELNPVQLGEAVKEWLALDDAQTQVVAGLIKKTFVDPYYEFLAPLYHLPSKPNSASVPPLNVVNLKKGGG